MLDVLIVGAGPAGSATAYRLARLGFQVALLDRAVFPREKACGDMLSGTAVRCLDELGLEHLYAGRTTRETWQAGFNDPAGRMTEFRVNPLGKAGRPRWATVPRIELDAALVEHARRAGAQVYERATVEAFTVEPKHIQVKAAGVARGELAARLLVIAQGSVGTFVRRLSQKADARAASYANAGPAEYFAWRGYYEGPAGAPLAIRFTPDLAPGYEWQFPSGDGYNIGVYTTAQTARRLRLDRRLEQSPFLQDKRLIGRLRGAYLNTGFYQALCHADRRLWVGDAAGLIQPHLGEGIAPALQSAEIAAECAAEALAADQLDAAGLAGYTRRLHAEFDGEWRLSRLLTWFTRRPAWLQAAGGLLAANYDRLSGWLAQSKPASRSWP